MWVLRSWLEEIFLHSRRTHGCRVSSASKVFQFFEDIYRWVWRHSRDDVFSVASAYQIQDARCPSLDTHFARDNPILPLIWNSWVPSKIMVSYWQLMHDIFPSKENLFKWKVIIDIKDISYIFCDYWLESVSHLFVTCEFSSIIWYEVFKGSCGLT